MGDRLVVSELFFSLQGESTYAGLPCSFIRLWGCNLRCTYCDSAYSYQGQGREYRIAELISFIQERPTAIVEVTGGEPLLQENIYPFLAELVAMNRTVLLETNGSVNVAHVPQGVVKIMDMKCPSSGMSSRVDLDNLALLNSQDEIKFVIGNRNDYQWAMEKMQQFRLDQRSKVLFSPVAGMMNPAELARWILEDGLPVRFQLQLHKILWPDLEHGA